MTPTSTYRLQLGPDLGFREALALVDYLDALGVGALYTSPILRAEPGSTHGYDCVDPTEISPELGGEEAFIALADALKKRGMGLVVDFVPNHMGIASHENAMWNDLLTHGPSSPFAHVFDVDWGAAKIGLAGKVLLPILGDSYGAVLERGELVLAKEGEVPCVRYYERRLPLAPQTVPQDLDLDADALDALLSKQHYRLSHWRVALETINYRRFFDVNTLAAVRMEDPRVFALFHEKILSFVKQRRITGIRLDHTDGLHDPTAYFAELRERAGDDAWIVAEKILSTGEYLPPQWRIEGTTGYELASAATQVLIDGRAAPALDAFYRRFTGDDEGFAKKKRASKRLVLQTSLASEVAVLARMLERIAEADRKTRDLSRGAMVSALVETIAAFPVYRTYLRPDGSRQPHDDVHLETALSGARSRSMSAEVYDFLADVLSLRERTPEKVAFVMKLQQLTGPAMAKAVEDTAFYAYGRLLAANEVGGDPEIIGIPVLRFHAENRSRLADWPRAMTTTSTHDTKRGEDARARLAVLTEIPDLWRKAVSRWSRVARARKEKDDAPSRADEYVFYQSLLGVLPFDLAAEIEPLVPRLASYLVKAAREAKIRTSWVNQDTRYEHALTSFVEKMLREPRFMDDFAAFARKIGKAAATNALAQRALLLCSPGVPDIYRGAELWEQSLVDPDNRRPVDYRVRRELLARMGDPAELLARYENGAIKLLVTTRLLHLRREHSELFLGGAYRPLEGGPHAIAFERRLGSKSVVCVVPRLPFAVGGVEFPLGDAWGEALLEALPASCVDVLTGARHARGEARLSDIFRVLPVAVLASA